MKVCRKIMTRALVMVFIVTIQCQKPATNNPNNQDEDILDLPTDVKTDVYAFVTRLRNIGQKTPIPTDIENRSVQSINKSISSFSKAKFTNSQLEILGEIAAAKAHSNSYVAFSSKILHITEKIHTNVPKAEQKDLLLLVGTLYYGLGEVNELVRKGIIKASSEGKPRKVTLNMSSGPVPVYGIACPTGHQYDFCVNDCVPIAYVECDSPTEPGWWDDINFLAAVWAIAITEPTPFGEAVASALTVIIGAYLILSRTECIENYVECVFDNPSPSCADCLHFCVVQGFWPHYCN